MWEEDENDLAVFEFYKKLPQEEREMCGIFITPEKILEIQTPSYIAEVKLKIKMDVLRGYDYNIIKKLILDGHWGDYTIFKRVVKVIKEYYQLRPEVIEKYPELLI